MDEPRNSSSRQQALKDLYRFLDNEMSPEEALEFEERLEREEWLDRAREHELELRGRMQEMHEADLQDAAANDPGAELDAILEEAGEAGEDAREGSGRGTRWKEWAMAAAAAVLIAVLGFNLGSFGGGPVSAKTLMGEVVLSYHHSETAPGPNGAEVSREELRLTLPDELSLESASRVDLDGDLMHEQLGEDIDFEGVRGTRADLLHREGNSEALYIFPADAVELSAADGATRLTYTCPLSGHRALLWRSGEHFLVLVADRSFAEMEASAEHIETG